MVFKFLILGAALGCSCTTFASEDLLFSHSEQDKMSGFESGIPDNSSYTSPTGSPPNNSGGMVLSSESLGGSSESTLNANAQSPEQLAFEEVLSGKRPLFPETSFKSEYGKLTIRPVNLDRESREKLKETEFMKGSLENAFNAALSGEWLDACSSLENIYDYVGNEWKSLPLSFSGALDFFYISSCLCLFESGIPSPENPSSSYNPCYAFAAEPAKILMTINFTIKADGKDKNIFDEEKVSDVLLPTAGVYLYALGRFLQGRRNPEKFGLVYRIAATHLCESLQDKYHISWALRSAYEDEKTRELVIQEEPEPCLF